MHANDNPIGTLYWRSWREITPFNFTYKGGLESLSFFVPKFDMGALDAHLSNRERSIAYACAAIGRYWDVKRCVKIGVRIHDEGRKVEIRLSFKPPWYLDEQHGEKDPDDRDEDGSGVASSVQEGATG